jgi:hypothetical protein
MNQLLHLCLIVDLCGVCPGRIWTGLSDPVLISSPIQGRGMGLPGPNLCEWSTQQRVKASQSTRGVRRPMIIATGYYGRVTMQNQMN